MRVLGFVRKVGSRIFIFTMILVIVTLILFSNIFSEQENLMGREG